MRARRRGDAGSLDSLLDTMTNVVGILVILLVVTQLGVRDAISRISQSEAVSPEALASAQSQLDELNHNREMLGQQVALIGSDETSVDWLQQTQKVAAARRQLEALRNSEREREALIKQHLDEARQQAEASKERLAQLENEAVQLESQLNEAEQEVARLRAQLAIAPDLGGLPTKVVTIPNPRAAPQGASAVEYLCLGERIVPVDLEALRDRAQKRTTYLVSRYRLGRDKAKGIDGELLTNYFNKEKIRTDNFELEMTIWSGRVPALLLHPRRDAGESVETLQGKASRFERLMARADSKQHYLRFQVWPDSFETYLVAREIATRRDMLAGWIPKSANDVHGIALGGPLRVGPPPKPAQPKPAQPKPTPPKPTQPKPTQPTPKPQPKPVDEID